MNDLHATPSFKALDEGRLQPVDREDVVTPECDLCGDRKVVQDGIGLHAYPETAPCPKCQDGSWAYRALIARHQSETGAALTSVNEKSVMVCPQCEGEGGYPDGLDEAACHTDCTRCDGNGWIVDIAALAQPVEAKCPKCWCREMAPLDDGSGSRCVNCKHVQPVEAGEDG